MLVRPGLVSVTFRQLTPEAVTTLAVEAGLEAIEWGGDIHVPPDNLTRAREVRDRTLDAGIEVAAYGSYWRAEPGGFDPILETAQILGAPTIRVWAGSKGSVETGPRERAQIVETLRGACETADRTISLEYHAGTLTDTLASTLELVRETDHSKLRLYWQPVPNRSLDELRGEIEAIKPYLSNIHVFQWTRQGSETLRHPLSEGEAIWPSLLRAVADESRFALLEFVPNDDPASLSREATTLREWLR